MTSPTGPDARPFPPGEYGVVVVGSGPGGLQVSYYLSRLGIDHAVISADPAPGGMFRQLPFFQRLLSWTKPHTAFAHDSREYERYDFNSLVAFEPPTGLHHHLIGEVGGGESGRQFLGRHSFHVPCHRGAHRRRRTPAEKSGGGGVRPPDGHVVVQLQEGRG